MSLGASAGVDGPKKVPNLQQITANVKNLRCNIIKENHDESSCNHVAILLTWN